MPKSITRTVLSFPSTSYPGGYDSGSLDVGDLSELYINIVGTSIVATVYAVDANGLLTTISPPTYNSGPLSIGAGFADDASTSEVATRSDVAFGDTIRVKVPGNVTFSLSIEGK